MPRGSSGAQGLTAKTCPEAFPIKANDYTAKWFTIEPGSERTRQIRGGCPFRITNLGAMVTSVVTRAFGNEGRRAEYRNPDRVQSSRACPIPGKRRVRVA